MKEALLCYTEPYLVAFLKVNEWSEYGIGMEFCLETLLPIKTPDILFELNPAPTCLTSCSIAACRKEVLDTFGMAGSLEETIEVESNVWTNISAFHYQQLEHTEVLGHILKNNRIKIKRSYLRAFHDGSFSPRLL